MSLVPVLPTLPVLQKCHVLSFIELLHGTEQLMLNDKVVSGHWPGSGVCTALHLTGGHTVCVSVWWSSNSFLLDHSDKWASYLSIQTYISEWCSRCCYIRVLGLHNFSSSDTLYVLCEPYNNRQKKHSHPKPVVTLVPMATNWLLDQCIFVGCYIW